MLNRIKNRILRFKQEKMIMSSYFKRYIDYSFQNLNCKDERQFEGSIIRLYHTIEKGLSYENYRPGFGRENVDMLFDTSEQYAKAYDIDTFFYQTAISTIECYIEKNKEYGIVDETLYLRYKNLPGKSNGLGGTISFVPLNKDDYKKMNYEQLVKSRHSIRHFSTDSLSNDLINRSLELAQKTPSACNRQGWKCYIVENRETIKSVLNNQNGNRGFGNEIDKLILVVGDLRLFNRDREVFQVFIDGGMYAMRVIDSLHYYGIASIPLSASLTCEQEKNVRRIMKLNDAEVPILFIGIGNYPNNCITTRSERHKDVSQTI